MTLYAVGQPILVTEQNWLHTLGIPGIGRQNFLPKNKLLSKTILASLNFPRNRRFFQDKASAKQYALEISQGADWYFHKPGLSAPIFEVTVLGYDLQVVTATVFDCKVTIPHDGADNNTKYFSPQNHTWNFSQLSEEEQVKSELWSSSRILEITPVVLPKIQLTQEEIMLFQEEMNKTSEELCKIAAIARNQRLSAILDDSKIPENKISTKVVETPLFTLSIEKHKSEALLQEEIAAINIEKNKTQRGLDILAKIPLMAQNNVISFIAGPRQ